MPESPNIYTYVYVLIYLFLFFLEYIKLFFFRAAHILKRSPIAGPYSKFCKLTMWNYEAFKCIHTFLSLKRLCHQHSNLWITPKDSDHRVECLKITFSITWVYSTPWRCSCTWTPCKFYYAISQTCLIWSMNEVIPIAETLLYSQINTIAVLNCIWRQANLLRGTVNWSGLAWSVFCCLGLFDGPEK